MSAQVYSAAQLYTGLVKYMAPLIKTANKLAESIKKMSSPSPTKQKPLGWNKDKEISKLRRYEKLIREFSYLEHKYGKEIESGEMGNYQAARKEFTKFMDGLIKTAGDVQISRLLDSLFEEQHLENPNFFIAAIQLFHDVMMGSKKGIKPTKEDLAEMHAHQKNLLALQVQFKDLFQDIRRPQPSKAKIPKSLPATPPLSAGAGAGPGSRIESKRQVDNTKAEHLRRMEDLERKHRQDEARLKAEFENAFSLKQAELQKLQEQLQLVRGTVADNEQQIARLQGDLKQAGEGEKSKLVEEAMLVAHRARLKKLLADHKTDLSPKLRKKYEEALFTVDQMLDNLVKDLAELSKRVLELEKALDEARKEAAYWRGQAEQFQRHSEQLENEQAKLKSSLETLRKAHAAELTGLRAQHETAMSGLRTELTSVQMRVGERQQKAQERHAKEKEELERSIAGLRKQIEDLQTSEHDKKNQIDRLEPELKRNQEQEQKHAQEHEKLKAEFRDQVSALNELKSSLDAARREKTQLEATIKSLEEMLAKERAQYLEQLTKLGSSGGDRVAKISAAYEETVKKLTQDIAVIRQESGDKTAEIKRLGADLKTAVDDLRALRQERDQLLAAQRTLKAENADLQDELNYWSREAKLMQDYANALHEQYDRDLKKLRANLASSELKTQSETKRAAALERQRDDAALQLRRSAEELQSVQHDHAVSKRNIGFLTADIDDLKKTVEALRLNLAGALTANDEQLRKSREELRKKQQDLDVLISRARELDAAKQRSETTLAALNVDYKSLDQRYGQAQRSLVANNDKILKLEADLLQQQQLVIQLRGQGGRGDVKGVEDQIQLLKGKLREEQARSKEFEDQSRTLHLDLGRMAKERDSLRKENADLGETKEKLLAQLRTLRESNDQLTERLRESQAKSGRDIAALNDRIKDLTALQERADKRFQETIADKDKTIAAQSKTVEELRKEQEGFNRELRRVQAELRQMTSKHDVAIAEVERLNGVVKGLRDDLTNRDKTIKEMQETLTENRRQIDQLIHSEYDLNERIVDLTSDVKRKNERISTIEQEIQTEIRKHSETQSIVTQLRIELARFTTVTATAGAPDQGKGTTEPKRKADVPGDAKSAGEDLKTLRDQLQAANAQLEASARTIQALGKDKQELTTANATLAQEKRDLETRVRNLTQERDELQAENTRIHGQLTQEMDRVSALEGELREKNRIIADKDRKLSREQVRYDLLNEDLEHMRNDLGGVTEQLATANQELLDTRTERDDLRVEVERLRKDNVDIASALQVLHKLNQDWEFYARGLEKNVDRQANELAAAEDVYHNYREGAEATIRNLAGERDDARHDLEEEQRRQAATLVRLATAERDLDAQRVARESAQADLRARETDLVNERRDHGRARDERDAAVRERGDAAREHAAAMAALTAERDAAVRERAAALVERDAAVGERDVARGERAAALAQRDAVVVERDAARQEAARIEGERVRQLAAAQVALQAAQQAEAKEHADADYYKKLVTLAKTGKGGPAGTPQGRR